MGVRLALTVQQILPKYPTLPLVANSADYVYTAAGADFADGFSFAHTGKEVLLALGGVAGGTITINSVVDDYKRTGDITTYAIGAAEYVVFPPFALAGWRRADGTIWGAASIATIELAVLRLPD